MKKDSSRSRSTGARCDKARAIHNSEVSIVIVGGDGRQRHHQIRNASIRCFASSKHGNGNPRSVIAALRSGSVDLVILLVRWLGHPERHAIVATCRTQAVRYLVIERGMTAAWRAITAFVKAEVDDVR